MNNNDELYPLEDSDIELLAGYQLDIAAIQGRMLGVLDSFVKRHKLPGRWALAPNRREVQRIKSTHETPTEI